MSGPGETQAVVRISVSAGARRRGAPPKVGDMPSRRTPAAATVGVAEHGNAAVLVTIAAGGELLASASVDLTDRVLPTHPHHHEGSWAVGRYRNTPGARVVSLA